MPESYIRRILNANIYDLVKETRVDGAPKLSGRLQNQVLIKREDLQPVFSFKIRGAYNRMLKLNENERTRGVVTASAGNHAQGVAMSASHLGIRSIIVMPTPTPEIKVEAVRALGAEVVLVGDNFDEAAAHARRLVADTGMVFVHPFDDPEVIAGQGTVGVELLRQVPGGIDAIFVGVGGGGLCAGVAAYVKYVSPHTRIIAVEPDDAACLKAAMEKQRRVKLKHVGLFADGAAVAQIGKETFRLLRDLVDDVITVTTDEVCAAVKDIFDDTRSIAEPAGALSVAGLKKYVLDKNWSGKTLVAVESGANMNFDRLRYISERTEIGEKREAVLAVTIPERPGSFREFCHLVEGRMVTEFNYRYGDTEQAHIFVGVQIKSDVDRGKLLESLARHGYPVVDMTDDEMAKLHIRHMVGGRATLEDERLFRFEFPEKPGALANFLNRLAGNWNISLFHYRNHGAAFGRVLVGLQVPPGDKGRINEFLKELGYDHREETDNPAYKFFLR
jgi:threonine dehydratase